MVKAIGNIILTLLLITNIISAQNFSVYATTDSAEYIVGDYIKYSLQLQYPKGTQVDLPSIMDSLKVLEFIKEEPAVVSELGSKVSDVRTFIFSYYDSSKVTIPSFTISYKLSGEAQPRFINTNTVDIVVKSLDVDTESDIIDVKKPQRIPFDWLFAAIMALVIILILAGIYFGYTYYKKKKAGEPVIKKVIIQPPHKIALKALYDLEEQKLWQQGKVKEYHSEVTQIVRTYFEKRFGILALEMPSSELLEELKKITEADSIFNYTKQFLENADMVKFAKFQPMPTVNEEMMKQAKEIVYKTKKEEASDVVEEVKDVQ